MKDKMRMESFGNKDLIMLRLAFWPLQASKAVLNSEASLFCPAPFGFQGFWGSKKRQPFKLQEMMKVTQKNTRIRT